VEAKHHQGIGGKACELGDGAVLKKENPRSDVVGGSWQYSKSVITHSPKEEKSKGQQKAEFKMGLSLRHMPYFG